MSPMASIDYITIESELGKNFVSRNFLQKKKIKKFRRKKNYFHFDFTKFSQKFSDSNAGCGGGISGTLYSRYCGGFLNSLTAGKASVPICGKYLFFFNFITYVSIWNVYIF